MKYLILLGLLNLNSNYNYRALHNDSHKLLLLTPNAFSNHKTAIAGLSGLNLSGLSDNSYFEDSVEEVLSKLFVNKDVKGVDAKLSSIDKDSKITLQNKKYWKGYLLYNKSLFYKASLKDDDNASKAIDAAIETMEKSPKSSDDYALLAACKSFSIQFANMTQLAKISGEVTEEANKSLELNPKNIRAYYVLASNNFYTPKMFGGMVKVEEFSLKGLACPNTLDDNFYSPYWGKPKLYAMYIKYLETENRKDDAKKYRILARNEFPSQFKS
jgi:hypothetical protein